MKILKIKYILIISSFVLTFYIIFKTFNLVVPNNDIPVVSQNIEPLRVEIKPKRNLNNLEIYEIINEKKEFYNSNKKEILNYEGPKKKKDLEKSIEFTPSPKKNQNIEDYRLQFASIRSKTKIKKFISEFKIKSDLLEDDFIIQEVDLPNLGKFFRIQSLDTYSKIDAKKMCNELLIKKLQCLIVKLK